MHLGRHFACLAAGLVLAGGPAATLTISPADVGPGRPVMIEGTLPETSCPAGVRAVLTGRPGLFPPDGTGPDAPRGPFRIRYRVPMSTEAGTYQIGVRCGRGLLARLATLRVERPRDMTRWWVTAGTLLIGIGVYLGIAELQPWRRRREPV